MHPFPTNFLPIFRKFKFGFKSEDDQKASLLSKKVFQLICFTKFEIFAFVGLRINFQNFQIDICCLEVLATISLKLKIMILLELMRYYRFSNATLRMLHHSCIVGCINSDINCQTQLFRLQHYLAITMQMQKYFGQLGKQVLQVNNVICYLPAGRSDKQKYFVEVSKTSLGRIKYEYIFQMRDVVRSSTIGRSTSSAYSKNSGRHPRSKEILFSV